MINFPGKQQYNGEDLYRIVKILRGEGGCPWDREQTHASIRRNLLEEADELCEAIDQADPAMMREELGDVWLQVVFHAVMAEEEGSFTLDEVADAECRKLIGRHAHVFGSATAATGAEALQVWDEQKRLEKQQRTPGEAMDAVCRTLPALWRAEKVQKKSGETMPDPETIAAQVRLTADRLADALVSGGDVNAALGEALFAAVCAARLSGTDPEEALHARCESFIRGYLAAEDQNR